jgi:isopentenyl-diphosphate delta-isomerase
MSQATKKRKLEHLDICTDKDVEYGDNWLKHVRLVHDCLPQKSLAEVDTSTELLGKELKAPFIIAAITGGVAEAKAINHALASVAEELGIGFGVGSQRAMLEDPGVTDTFSVRDVAPNTLVLGNIGAANLHQYTVDEVAKAMKAIGADAICVHINPAQEAAQQEGDVDFSQCLQGIEKLAKRVPVVAKEVGNGVSRENALELKRAGAAAIDVGGFGGTSWVLVDKMRKNNEGISHDWGIPTAASIMECAQTVPLIATGGMRTGLDAAKAIGLGADAVGMALPALRAYRKGGQEGVKRHFQKIIADFKTYQFLTGSKTLDSLKAANLVVTGELAHWCEARGLDYRHYGQRYSPHTII